MKATFTAKEYARLLELVHYGLHVVHAYHGPENPSSPRYDELEQKLLALATPMGCGDLVETLPDERLRIAEKVVRDERVEKILSEHTNDTFWHELVARLADRDCSSEQARRHLAASTPGVEPPPSIEQQVETIEDAYWAEFQKHDLNNVIVLRAVHG